MGVQDLEIILESRFKGTVTECSLKKSKLETPTPRDRLLMVFQRRLLGIENLRVLTETQKAILPEMKSFIQELSLIPSNEDLYTWKAEISGNQWKGWATNKKVIYALQRNT